MKPINITEQVVADMAREFVQELYKTGRVKTDSFSYKKNFASVKKDAVEVNFTYEAYSQMFALIDHFDCEVAWRGIVNRIDKTHFQITKILLYPQTVTGTTVDTDQEEFSKWFQALPVETIRNLRFQGHSHVDFGVTPSSRDMEDQWRFIDGLKPTSYQIFMIWNKKRQYNVRVIDLADNVISRLLLEILTRLDFSRMQTKRFESALYMSQAQSQITELMEQAPIMVKQLRRKKRTRKQLPRKRQCRKSRR